MMAHDAPERAGMGGTQKTKANKEVRGRPDVKDAWMHRGGRGRERNEGRKEGGFYCPHSATRIAAAAAMPNTDGAVAACIAPQTDV